jgi:histone H3/H4
MRAAFAHKYALTAARVTVTHRDVTSVVSIRFGE